MLLLLLFLGFLVAKTKDVMDAAIDIKEKDSSSSSSIQHVSLVDVPIGKAHILTLSTDSSTLAVSVDAHIYLFHVHSLLDKVPPTRIPFTVKIQFFSINCDPISIIYFLSSVFFFFAGAKTVLLLLAE